MTLRRTIGRLAAAMAAFAFLVPPAAAEAPIPPDARMVPDPAVKRGTLPNGLRYAVMQNASPRGIVSIRLAMDVGSFLEEDGERGYAHFIEHMAFRSTRQAPDGAFDNRFAALGVAVGRDQNAVTGLDSTIYSVDLPTADIAAVRLLLGWMRGAADGILFTQAAMDVERGVVLAERQARESPLTVVQDEMSRFQAPGLRSVDRDPGGTVASLRAATPAGLQRFYDRWYRPENGMVVLIGDAPAADLERAVADIFGSWTARGPAGVRPAPPTEIAARGLDALSRSGPSLPSAISACRLGPPDRDRSPTLQRTRREAYSVLWTAILGKRLNHLSSVEDSPLAGAAASVNRDVPDAMIACVVAVPNGDKWREALAGTQAELRRFAAAGPTQVEVETSIEDLRSRLRAAAYQGGTRNSSSMANQIVEAELNGRVFQDPVEAMRSFDIVVAGMTPADVLNGFKADWSGTGPLLAMAGERAPSRDELLSAWTENEKAPLMSAYADQKGSVWAYPSFGKKGKVKKRQRFTNPDYARFTFANGTLLTFRHSDLQENGAEIRIRFGWGEMALDHASRLPVALGASLFPTGGLGRMDFEQIASALNNTSWSFTLGVDTDSYVLSSSPLSEQVPQQMKLLAAYMTDPGFRSLMDDKLPTAMDFIYRSYRTEPSLVAVEALESRLYPGKPTLPTREQLMGYRVSDFERMLRPVLTTAPVEVTIVGDLTEEEAIQAVATTFGALPRRAPLPAPPGEGPFRRFPESLPTIVRAQHEGPAEKAAALLMWPLWVATPERRNEEYAVALAAAVFEARLLQRVRVAMGKVYSPTVASVTPDYSDQGYLAASVEGSPADIDQLVAAAREIGADLAAGKISQQEVDSARDPLIAARRQAQSRNEAWAGVLSVGFRHPEALDELLAYEGQLKALTLDDIRRAAKDWLSRDPMVSIALPAAPAAGSTR
jgi:zinc protease